MSAIAYSDERWRHARRTAPVFATEADAQRYSVEALSPFCSSLVEQPQFANGIRPDAGFRLRSLPTVPLILEVKNFSGEGYGSLLAEAIAQASDYSQRLRMKAFVGPLFGKQATALSWTENPAGAMCLVGAQFNVGALVVAGDGKNRIALLMLAQAPLATMTFNQYGDPDCRLHSNAEHLFRYKERKGSASWR